MTVANNDLSEAFISYVGYRKLSAPVMNIKHLIVYFGAQREQELLPLAESLLREVSSVPIELPLIQSRPTAPGCSLK
jgi:hypothetical protein